MKTICKNCGALFEEGLAFCPYCETQLAPPAYAAAGPYAGTYPPSKKKLSKSALIVIIAAAAVAVVLILIINSASNIMTQDYFKIGKDQVPSMKFVLGELRTVSNVTSSSYGDVKEVIVEYRVAEGKNRDMLIYEEALINDFGFLSIGDYVISDDNDADFVFIRESVEEGYSLLIRLANSNIGYTLTINRWKDTPKIHGGIDENNDNGENQTSVETDQPVPGPGAPDNDGPIIDGGPGSDEPQNMGGALMDFSRGKFSINQISEEYGTPDYIMGIIVQDFNSEIYDEDMVEVLIVYSNATVSFLPADAKQFSFYSDPFTEWQYPPGEKDKDIKLELYSVIVNGPGVELPYDHAVGESTKEQVIKDYGKDPFYRAQNEWVNLIVYIDPSDELVNLDYAFDQYDVLKTVTRIWLYPVR